MEHHICGYDTGPLRCVYDCDGGTSGPVFSDPQFDCEARVRQVICDISDPSVDEVGERTNELTNTVLSLLLQQFTVLYTVCNRSIQHGNNSECRKGDSHDGKQVIINVQIR
jgi:hypothetical protein